MQLIYQGTTDRCIPKGVDIPPHFDASCTVNNWSYEAKAIQLLNKIVFPCVKSKRSEFGVSEDQKAMLIFVVIKGKVTGKVNKVIEKIIIVLLGKQHDRTIPTLGFDSQFPSKEVSEE